MGAAPHQRAALDGRRQGIFGQVGHLPGLPVGSSGGQVIRYRLAESLEPMPAPRLGDEDGLEHERAASLHR